MARLRQGRKTRPETQPKRLRRGHFARGRFRTLSRQGSLVAQAVGNVFQVLRVGATLRDQSEWHAIYSPQGEHESVGAFEAGHGKDMERHKHNTRCVEQARREGEIVVGRHAGFCDLFVPIPAPPGASRTILITGPLATTPATAADIGERWHSLTGQLGQLSDPEFSHYLSATLHTLTLDQGKLQDFQRLLRCYAALLAGQGESSRLSQEAAPLLQELSQVRFAERMWETARSMLDERTASGWLSPRAVNQLAELRLERLPEHVLVGLAASAREASDPIAELLQRHAFQRACVELARSVGNVLCGRVGDHGVTFMLATSRSQASARALVEEFAREALRLGRQRFGLELYFGMSSFAAKATGQLRYEQAMAAAERALLEGVSLREARADTTRAVASVRSLRRELGAVSTESATALSARFERYIDAVLVHAGHRPDPVRAHLEAGLDQLAQAQIATGALDERGYQDLCENLESETRDLVTLSELLGAYRRALSALTSRAAAPVKAGQDRSLGRAVTFVRRHFAEPLTMSQVARVAGFAPGYFCRLFKRREGVTFDRFLNQVRIAHAKQLLEGSTLSAERIAALSGYTLRPYFHRVFKQMVGRTPLEFRSWRAARARGGPRKREN